MSVSVSFPGRRLLAASVVVAPVVFLLSDVAYISAGNGINNGVLGGAIGVWSCFLLGWALLGISRALEPIAPRGALTMLVLAVPMVAGGTAFNVNGIHWDLYGNDYAGATDLSGADLLGLLAFLPWGWFAPASLVVAGIFVWRTGIGPRWAGALTALSGLLFISARPAQIDALAIACDVVMVLGLVPVGLAMLAERGPSHDDALVASSAVR